MSKIQGVPFIQSVINSLTAELKNDLLDLVNGEEKTPVFRSLINKQHAITAGTDKNKVQFVFLETWNKNYTGYLIYNNSYCVLVGFNANTQDMSIVNIDVTKQTYSLVKQPLSILEFRFCLQDAAEHITSDEIDSGSTPADKLLAADGDGGVKWVYASDSIKESDVETGDAVKLFGFDAQGNLVADDLPEGILVDETIIEDSPNAVAGGAVYDALADVDAELETKANVDGNYPTMTVGVADQLSPYDDESGDDQDEPFSFQATGTGNGSQPDFATGSIALMKEKQGNTVVVNQFAYTRQPTTTVNDITFTNNNDGSYTLNGTATGTAFIQVTDDDIMIIGHKYLINGCPNGGSGLDGYTIWNNTESAFDNGSGVIYTCSSRTGNIYIRVAEGTTINNLVFRPHLIDLTQWFNGDIPADIIANPSNFYRYYQGSLAYNTGELVNANGRYIKCIGMNQWDEEWENGYISVSTGENISLNSTIRSKNYIKVVPNTSIYLRTAFTTIAYCPIFFYDKDKNFIGANSEQIWNAAIVVPSNAEYMRFYMNGNYGATYNHDISINLYYEDEARCLTYEPYEVLTNNDTGTETLLAFDKKLPDGTIKHNTGVLVMDGSDNAHKFTYKSSSASMHAYKCGNVNTVGATSLVKGNVVSTKFVRMASTYAVDNVCIYVVSDGEIYVSFKLDSNFDTIEKANTWLASNNFTIYYELTDANKTTEQGTPYSENLVIDDFGSMDFQGTNGVPQGNLIFYPVDYKAFIDTLYDYTEGTPSELAKKSDLSAVDNKHDALYAIMQENAGGVLRHMLADNNDDIDFNDTDVLTLKNFTCNYVADWHGYNLFYFNLGSEMKFTLNKISALCSGYKMATSLPTEDKVCLVNSGYVSGSNATIGFVNTSYSDADTFKNSIKDMLIAYEKASS